MLKIASVSIKERWNNWLADAGGSFLQGWQWGEILKSEGKEVERLAFSEGDKVIAQAQIIFAKLPLGWSYAFCPGGPVVVGGSDIWETFLVYLKNRGCIFLRCEPAVEVHSAKFSTKKTIEVTPAATIVIDITRSPEELMSAMHPKTRYNIRLAEKKGVRVVEQKDFGIFWSLMGQTAKRDGFRLHEKKHYERVIGSPDTRQFIAYLDNKPIAAAIAMGFGRTYTYIFGASDYEQRDLMAPYLVQWEMIKLARQLGFSRYDMFGISSGYPGVSRFKLGFGGRAVERPGTFDLIISPRNYKIYQLLRKLRRMA